ncbi:STAS domain-containing protein [Planosporangium sp. 12N6]|uniref:STAS domain-containing protein n=1 Tax=Planosporangium spinosum TaxID=3402278 RepID=UPI003CE6C270
MDAEGDEADLSQPVRIPGEDPRFLAGPAEPSDLVISTRRLTADGEIVVSLDGDLDIDAADRVRLVLVGAARTAGCRRLRVDLAEVSFIDSVGLGALVAGCRAATAAGVTFTMTNAQPPVRRVLEVTRLAGPLGLAGP